MMPTHDEDVDAELAAETLFESYLDRDSGAWSIRRISVVPVADEAEPIPSS